MIQAPNKPWWKSKTKWGAIILAAAGAMASPAVVAVLPEVVIQWGPALQVIGTIVGGFGVRDALDK